jgi:putative transposase
MDKQLRQAIAQFRYGLISPIICRKNLSRGEQRTLLEDIASKEYQLPNSDVKSRVSIRSLERYLAAYRKHGIKGLEPSERTGRSRAIPDDVFEKAALVRKELPSRSVDTIIRMLELSGIVAKGTIKRSTLSERLSRQGLSRQKLTSKASDGNYRRFGKSHRNELWQGDIHDTLRMPDSDGIMRQVHLVAFIDDYTRLVVHGEFYFDEKMPRIEDCLKKAILKYGKPEQIYVDNAKVYSGHHMGHICAKLGIHRSLCTPNRPAGKGKIERFFGYVEANFKPEAQLLIRKGVIRTLEDLNRYFMAWVDVAYNNRRHSTTKQLPKVAYDTDNHPVSRVERLDDFLEAFLYEDTRKADKTACIKVEGNQYEVEACLAGKTVEVRYDPYDLTVIQVWHEGVRHKDAIPIDIANPSRPGMPKQTFEQAPQSGVDSGLTYLELLRREQEKRQLQEHGISYRKGAGDHD